MFNEEDVRRAKPVEAHDDFTRVQHRRSDEDVQGGRQTMALQTLALLSVFLLVVPRGAAAETVKWVIEYATKRAPETRPYDKPSVSTGDITIRANNSSVRVNVSSQR